MCAKHYENPTMLSRVTAKNVGDVFFETHCSTYLTIIRAFRGRRSSRNNVNMTECHTSYCLVQVGPIATIGRTN